MAVLSSLRVHGFRLHVWHAHPTSSRDEKVFGDRRLDIQYKYRARRGIGAWAQRNRNRCLSADAGATSTRPEDANHYPFTTSSWPDCTRDS